VVFQVKKGLLVRKEIRENLIHLVILASQVNKEILLVSMGLNISVA
jgi:ribosomal protein L7Ae-like RNA K-turn-binding protein